jgi:hypothetical protein
VAGEGGEQHRPITALVGEATGALIPAGELRRGGGLARPRKGVQQHHPLAVEGPIQRQQGLVAAVEADLRGAGQGRLGLHRLVPGGRPTDLDGELAGGRGGNHRQGGGLVDDGDHPVLQCQRAQGDLPDGIGRQVLAAAADRLP